MEDIADNLINSFKIFKEAYEADTASQGISSKNSFKTEVNYLNLQLEEYCLVQAFNYEAVSETAADKDEGEITAKEEAAVAVDETASSPEVEAVTAMNNMSTLTSDKLLAYDYITANYYTIDSTTSVSRDELNGQSLMDMDMTIDVNAEEYKVLIYHTHGTESFCDSREGNIEDTVIGVGSYLAELLEENYGIRVYHDTTVYDMKGGKLDRSTAYDYAREGVQDILEQNPSIEVVIDLHRDGVSENTRLVTDINGKATAQIMFLNGVSRLNRNGDIDYLPNPFKKENLAFSLQLYLTAIANYDSYMRKIFIKGYRYNLDMAERSLLVEVGGQTNTVEEAKNAMEPLAAILYKVLSG
jgi:stage II sporulation protein P